MTLPTTPRSVAGLLTGPALLVLGASVLALVSTLMAPPVGSAGSMWPIGTAVMGVILAALLLAWRAGMGWARWLAWGVSVLGLALSVLMLVVGIWAAGYYESPASDLPLLLGLPSVVLIGSGVVLWTVLRRRTA